MRSIQNIFSVAAGVLVVGLAVVPAAMAVTQNVWYLNAPGDSCQLSIPTTDTQVRPRANGYRNEGATNQFVICGFGSSRYYTGSDGGTNYANIQASSLDGVAHSMNCTFVAGASSGVVTYVPKTVSVPASGVSYAYISAADFGGSDGAPFANYELSVTCILPVNVAIVHLESNQRVDVGS